ARVAYEAYENAFNNDPRWAELEAAGGKRQRPLWASTGVKNPDYSKTLYVDGLVGGDVVNTMPEATLNAVAEVSVATSDTLSGLGVESAAIIEKVKSLGIDFDAELAKLESDGVASFISSWQDLLDDVQGKIDSVK
ncbi:MAG: transaldolase, partial [Bifidobacteriaceae bacterium]|nr:transaldolase [Bifidobacteriaceae bacterium]